MKESNWDEVLSAASRLQGIIPETVLVGGTVAAIFASHRFSYDADHVLNDLRGNYQDVLETLEEVSGWKTNRKRKPVLILGDLDGVETGIRQLIRSEPLETMEIEIKGQKITVPTPAEILRIKASLILKRNATRDYIDFIALSDYLGEEGTVTALESFDRLYPQENGNSAYIQLSMQLADPYPFDLEDTNLDNYKGLVDEYNSWDKIEIKCKDVSYFLTRNAEEEDSGPSFSM